MICLNCGHRFKGNFCPHCGQKANTKRLRLSEMTKNTIETFVGGDNRFVRSCRDLFLRPGIMSRNYLIGKRIRYYHPLQLYVYLLTAYAVISYVLGVSDTFFDEMTTLDFQTDVEPSEYASVDFILEQITKFSSNKLYGTIVIVLLSVVPYRWVFRKCRVVRQDGEAHALNHIEQFYTQLYHSCISLGLSVLMLPLCLIPGIDKALSHVFYCTTFGYIVFLYRQLMDISWRKSLLLSSIGYLLTFALVMLCVILFIIPFAMMEVLKAK